MDLWKWKLGKLPKPKSVTTTYVSAGLLRGVGELVDRRPHRVTPVVVADSWTRYRRNTPLLSLPRARMTPSLTTTSNRRQSVHTAQHTAGYLSSSWEPRSTVTNIISPSSTADVKKTRKETSKSTTDSSVLEDATTDVTELDDINSTSNNITTTTDISKKFVLPSSHLTMSNYLTNLSADVTTLTSQHGATSGSSDNNVNGIDVKEQAAEAEQLSVQANPNSQVMTSTRSGAEMMTYLSDDAGSSDDTQVQQGGATLLNDAKQVTSDPGETISDKAEMLSGSSKETVKNRGTTAALNDVSQVSSSNTGETRTTMNNDLMLVVTANNRWKNATVHSATDVDEDSTSDQSVDIRRMTNTRGDASALTLAVTTSTPNSTAIHVLNEIGHSRSGRGRSMTSPKHDQGVLSSVRTSSLTEDSMPTISADGTFSLWPRPVLLKSVNSTESDSTIYWSNQLVLPLLTVAVILALCLLIIAVACAVRYAGRYCCCLAPRVGSYTPSPSPTTQSHGYTASKPVMANRRQQRRVERARERTVVESTAAAERRAAQLAKTESTYRSIVIIGSDRPVRRAVPTKDPPIPHWTVREKIGNSWGNLSLVNSETTQLPAPPPPPPLPSKTIVLGRRDDQNYTGKRTVPAIVNLLEGRMEGTAQIHDSQLKLSTSNDTK